MNELEHLREQVRMLMEIRDAQAAEIAKLHAEIRELRKRLEEIRRERQPGPLTGLKVAVIGPSFRRETYRQVIESLGGQALVAASDEKLGQVYRVCSKAHGIIFITTYAGHDCDQQIKEIAERTGIPTVKLTFRGLDRLRDTALSMAEDMRAYKELMREQRKVCI